MHCKVNLAFRRIAMAPIPMWEHRGFEGFKHTAKDTANELHSNYIYYKNYS